MRKRERDEPRRLFKNVNFTRIMIRALLIFLFIAITFACSYWRDEGVLGTGWVRNSLADLYTIFQFPALNFFYTINFYTWTTYVVGLFVNAYLWSIAIAIILYILSKIFVTTDSFFLRPVGLLLIVAGLILIIVSQEIDFDKVLNSKAVIGFPGPANTIDKKVWMVFAGFIAIVLGRTFISFSLSKKKERDIKEISIR
jgi:hypothetical protein